MATADQPSGESAPGGVESIADPDNYTTRRWQKQLHDARVRVRKMKNTVLDRELENPRGYDEQVARRNVAEMVADYIAELRPILAQTAGEREDELLGEEVAVDDGEVRLEEFVERGWFNGDDAPSLRASMAAWDTCNDYLARLAGPDFEKGELPEDSL